MYQKQVKKIFFVTLQFVFGINITVGQQSPELKKASDHFIQYYISLPKGWSPDKQWPVVIAIEDANKQFKKNAERFMTARKGLPFIIVVPFITTNGQQGHRDSTIYPYSKSVWDSVEKLTICKFDIDGIQSIIRDVKTNYSGTAKVFLTGFEAGTHLVWAMILQHPELLYAAAPVAGNFRNRCVDDKSVSGNIARVHLPIRNFAGSDDDGFGKKGKFYNQYLEAKNLAINHGYKNISETEIPAKTHEPLTDYVLEYFYKTWKEMN